MDTALPAKDHANDSAQSALRDLIVEIAGAGVLAEDKRRQALHLGDLAGHVAGSGVLAAGSGEDPEVKAFL